MYAVHMQQCGTKNVGATDTLAYALSNQLHVFRVVKEGVFLSERVWELLSGSRS